MESYKDLIDEFTALLSIMVSLYCSSELVAEGPRKMKVKRMSWKGVWGPSRMTAEGGGGDVRGCAGGGSEHEADEKDDEDINIL